MKLTQEQSIAVDRKLFKSLIELTKAGKKVSIQKKRRIVIKTFKEKPCIKLSRMSVDRIIHNSHRKIINNTEPKVESLSDIKEMIFPTTSQIIHI